MNYVIHIVLTILVYITRFVNCNRNHDLVCKERNDGLRCVKTFNTEMIKEVSICKNSLIDTEAIKYECRISTYSHENKPYNAININLTVGNYSVTDASFQWFKKEESIHFSNKKFNKTNKKTLQFDFNNKTEKYQAELIIYNIEENTKYKIETEFDLDNETLMLSCLLEHRVEEEKSSLYMALLVIGVVVVIYVIIGMFFWICPPDSFKTIDELLSTLPTKHVEALKNLVENEGIIEIDMNENEHEPDDFNRRISFNPADNQAFELDDPDDEDLNRKIYREANKLRKMSHISLQVNSKKIVRFANALETDPDELAKNDFENLQLKIYREKRRRDSVHPFKKTCNLTTIESSDSE